MKTVFITMAIFFLGFTGPILAQDNPMKGPWDGPAAAALQPEKKSGQANAGASLVRFYQKYISPIDGSDCPMYPSDSRYAVECFQKHGFLLGWIMTVDRLYRCGRDELKRSPTVKVAGRPKCFDPVHNNDFWWNHGEQ